ncbi:MAG: hypothetical protein Q9219_005146 [cf. Caloplaca sp. 3 TL-2023]
MDPIFFRCIDHFLQRHDFVTKQLFTQYTTSQRRSFERDIYDYARCIGLSSYQAQISVQHAREQCGEKEYDSDNTRLGEDEIDDSSPPLLRPPASTGRLSSGLQSIPLAVPEQAHVAGTSENRSKRKRSSKDKGEETGRKRLVQGDAPANRASSPKDQCGNSEQPDAPAADLAAPDTRRKTPFVPSDNEEPSPSPLTRKSDVANRVARYKRMLRPTTASKTATTSAVGKRQVATEYVGNDPPMLQQAVDNDHHEKVTEVPMQQSHEGDRETESKGLNPDIAHREGQGQLQKPGKVSKKGKAKNVHDDKQESAQDYMKRKVTESFNRTASEHFDEGARHFLRGEVSDSIHLAESYIRLTRADKQRQIARALAGAFKDGVIEFGNSVLLGAFQKDNLGSLQGSLLRKILRTRIEKVCTPDLEDHRGSAQPIEQDAEEIDQRVAVKDTSNNSIKAHPGTENSSAELEDQREENNADESDRPGSREIQEEIKSSDGKKNSEEGRVSAVEQRTGPDLGGLDEEKEDNPSFANIKVENVEQRDEQAVGKVEGRQSSEFEIPNPLPTVWQCLYCDYFAPTRNRLFNHTRIRHNDSRIPRWNRCMKFQYNEWVRSGQHDQPSTQKSALSHKNAGNPMRPSEIRQSNGPLTDSRDFRNPMIQ